MIVVALNEIREKPPETLILLHRPELAGGIAKVQQRDLALVRKTQFLLENLNREHRTITHSELDNDPGLADPLACSAGSLSPSPTSSSLA